MGLFKKIGKAVSGLFGKKKKKKKQSAMAAVASAAAASAAFVGPQIPDYMAASYGQPPAEKKADFWGFLGKVGDFLTDGPKQPLDLNKYVTLPTVQLEASKQQNNNLLLIGAAVVALVLFTRKKS